MRFLHFGRNDKEVEYQNNMKVQRDFLLLAKFVQLPSFVAIEIFIPLRELTQALAQ